MRASKKREKDSDAKRKAALARGEKTEAEGAKGINAGRCIDDEYPGQQV